MTEGVCVLEVVFDNRMGIYIKRTPSLSLLLILSLPHLPSLTHSVKSIYISEGTHQRANLFLPNQPPVCVSEVYLLNTSEDTRLHYYPCFCLT